jgi:hypothetical protein
MGLLLRTLEALGLRLSIDEGSTPAARKPGKRVPAVDIDRVLDNARAKQR